MASGYSVPPRDVDSRPAAAGRLHFPDEAAILAGNRIANPEEEP